MPTKLYAAKLANRLDDVVDAAKAIEKIDDFTDAAKTIDKIEDVADVGKPLKLGEVTYEVSEWGNTAYHVKNNSFAQGVLDNIDPQFFGKNNRFADGFYVAQEAETAIVEVTYHGGNMAESSVIRFSMDNSKLKVLDLTDPNIAKAWKYDEALKYENDVVKGVIKANNLSKYDKTIELANRAREQGYNAIKFHSQRADGINMVIYETSEIPVNSVFTPEMIMPATP